MYDYEEACPVSKAASLLCERWTLQIIREMLMGATRFNEFQKYLPKLSPTLLNTRLKTLEAEGIILKRKIPEQKGHEYQLTPAGLALKPLMHEFGKWGMLYAFEQMDAEQLNLSAIIRDYAFAMDSEGLPAGDTTIQFNVESEDGLKKSFIMVRGGNTQICDENIGCDVDVYLTADLETLGRIWYGKLTIREALESGSLKVVGQQYLTKNLSRWLRTSQFSVYAEAPAQ